MINDFLIDTLKSNVMHGIFDIKVVSKATGEVLEQEDPVHNIIVIDSKEAIINTISTTTTDGVIEVLKIGDDVGGNVSMSGTPNLNFADANPDTITRTTGSWIDDGFIAEMSISITSSTNNNNTFVIGTVTATTLTLTVVDALTVESGTAGVSVVGTPSPNNPALPLDTFNSASMAIVYTPSVPFVIGYSSTKSVTFSLTIDGADLISNYPSDITKVITSAALHTGNGKVFAYKRFPQKSVSALVDILINWTIKFD